MPLTILTSIDFELRKDSEDVIEHGLLALMEDHDNI